MRAVVRILAIAVLASGAVSGCTVEAGTGVLSVTNRSDERIFLRFDDDPDRVVIYRVDPGAVGRADAPDPARRPMELIIYSADCTEISRQSDPALGQLTVGTSSMEFTAAPDPQVMSKPLLPLDASCR